MTVAVDSPRIGAAQDIPRRMRLGPHRWALVVLLAGTTVLYLWGLDGSGWANAFYSAAAQAGAHSWKAFLFGSSDAANSITVDKPPLSLWLPSLAIRVFGLNSWSILVPQAVIGVGSVTLLWDAVRRSFGETAGLIAGTVLALTPVAVTIFRFNNPDALLVLLMIAAVWALLRAVEDGRLRWLLLCGVFLGLGYLTKQLEVALVMPALALTYLVAGPRSLLARAGQLVLGLGAVIVAAGWWVLLVQLWPAGKRPWIGGTQTNSILELTLRYNGIGRLNGDEPGSTGSPGFISPVHTGGRTSAHPWGQTGIGRLFEPEQIGGIGWLLPAALIFAVALLAWRGRAPRLDRQRAAVIVWVVWLLTTATVFSFMAGIFHPYYTVALAPSIAAVIGIGVAVCWQRREKGWAKGVLAAAIVVTAATSVHVLWRVPDYYPWLRWAIPAGAIVLLAGLLLAVIPTPVAIALTALVALGGPAVYSITTVVRGNTGAMPIAGPVPRIVTAMTKGIGPVQRAEINVATGPGFLLPAGSPGAGMHLVGCTLLDSGVPDRRLVDLLDANAERYTWVAATVGSVCAAGYQLASGYPVMPVGGFNGTDPSPAPDAFLRLALSKRIHYFIVTNPIHEDKWGHLDTNALIQQWVQRNFTPQRVGRVLIYDLTG
ncbi:4-amino-4-deoxy-L-arabinose transferase-like glycosyltransferase [Mycolicibacterium sp. BK556]|uniref:ArnT family glycosyltransferase n=1 Tax=Mycobacteriaceae TaxID=1762 RepID=UPI00105C6795|nr:MULTISPECIES: glycosyltransferase family 39 protein [Mycobacteriaceae]MBB3601745.1 4-amino-4-deoxy-L-arabinose transferase-like glycosyltransferase [Mycolicibacterium sp. BK556]MBB3631497.1 4-amino-4-deoxy-L-arabinose transferase-like glycosyltransferase [Mycolicibacterium sp. BK607]